MRNKKQTKKQDRQTVKLTYLLSKLPKLARLLSDGKIYLTHTFIIINIPHYNLEATRMSSVDFRLSVNLILLSAFSLTSYCHRVTLCVLPLAFYPSHLEVTGEEFWESEDDGEGGGQLTQL